MLSTKKKYFIVLQYVFEKDFMYKKGDRNKSETRPNFWKSILFGSSFSRKEPWLFQVAETNFLLNSSTYTVLWLTTMLLGYKNNAPSSHFVSRAVLRPCDLLWWEDALHRNCNFYLNYRYDFQKFVSGAKNFLLN